MKILFHMRVLNTHCMTTFLCSSTISELCDYLVIMIYAVSLYICAIPVG